MKNILIQLTYILVRVVCGIVLPLVEGEDKLGAGDQAQGGGREGQDVVPENKNCYLDVYTRETYSVRQEN